MFGFELLQTIASLPAGGHAAALLRHAPRFPIVDPREPTLAEITPEGAVAAETFGARLTGFDCVRLFHSPVKRCRQTAEWVARGARSVGLTVDLVGAHEALGVEYIRDQVEVGRLGEVHGNHFVRLWFAGEIPETAILSAMAIAQAKLAALTAHLQEPFAQGRRLDLHVTHDWNVIILRELMLGVRHEDAGWVDFLDGVAFSWDGKELRAVYRDCTLTGPVPWRFN